MASFANGPDTQGIFQTDVILQTAILAGLKELKQKPWLLDYVWPNLASDPLTKDIYGQQEIDQAKKWVLNTNIPVFLNTRIDDFRGTCVSIAMASSEEEHNTLADTHYVPFVSTFTPNNMLNLSAAFQPTSFDPATGSITLPDSVAASVNFFPGMYLVNDAGESFQIIETPADNLIIISAPNQVPDMSVVTLQAPPNSWTIQMESQWMKETYHIGCHVETEPVHLLYLHSIVLFILLRNRKPLLEGRGIELTRVESQDFGRDEGLNGVWVYRRYIEMEGKVRHFWPIGDPIPTALGSVTQFKLIGSPHTPAGVPPDTQLVIGEDDQYITLGGTPDYVSANTEDQNGAFPADPPPPTEAAAPVTKK